VIKEMAAQTKAAHPIGILRELAETLEKALAICIDNASSEPVHRLRTTIRRFEAQLALIAQSCKLPRYHRQSKKLLMHLKKLRRLAGDLRDLDVQRDLVAAYATAETAGEVKMLRRHLKNLRKQQSIIFLKLALRLDGKISKELRCLFADLLPEENLELPSELVISSAQRWFTSRSHSPVTKSQLHATRKAAKIARYMCETVAGSAKARRIAAQFKKIQDRGGEWHDWLELAAAAESMLNKRHPLILRFREERDSRLIAYQRELRKLLRYAYRYK
jgi:CHAD domain-containing protein